MRIKLKRDFVVSVGELNQTECREIEFEEASLPEGHTERSALLATAFNYLFHENRRQGFMMRSEE